MTSLLIRIKAKIYQWFGIYLAHREELAYLKSAELKLELDRSTEDQLGLSVYESILLLLAIWRAKHRFVREWKYLEIDDNSEIAHLINGDPDD